MTREKRKRQKKEPTKPVGTRINQALLKEVHDLAAQKHFNIPTWLEEKFIELKQKLITM